MLIDLTSIVASGILIVLAVISWFANPFFRARNLFSPHQSLDDETLDAENPQAEVQPSKEPPFKKWPRISILITAHDNALELDNHLPTLLSQDYPGIFEVIVVAEKGDGSTEDVLKRYLNNRKLYYTFIPDSSRYMSRKKLMITLGVKAARYEWILLTEASSTPLSDTWLKTFAKNMTDDTNLVLGYSNYAKEAPAYYRFEQLRNACYCLNKAKGGIAYRTNSNNVAFKKEEFINKGGYRGNLQFLRGEYDFLVNKYAKREQTAVETDINSWVVDAKPSKKAWRQLHANYLCVRQQLRRNKRFRLIYNFDHCLFHLNYLAILSALVFSILTSRWILTGVAAIMLILTIVIRSRMAKKVLKRSKTEIPIWKVVPYEISILWKTIKYFFWYLRTDKTEFSSHKI
ncbi:MAG: group 2 glycosyl transferase [Prevotella sp.]|jgi:glycosyltransferase involved in cell wall biosynthesis|nr:group 2 glycosyl transferase [Prevotella sp.]MBQ2344745.1 group 2 glycosyl transferase [Prevotella sp.]